MVTNASGAKHIRTNPETYGSVRGKRGVRSIGPRKAAHIPSSLKLRLPSHEQAPRIVCHPRLRYPVKDHFEPVFYLDIYVFLVSLSVERLHPSRFEVPMSILKSFQSIRTRRFDWSVCLQLMTSGTEGYGGYVLYSDQCSHIGYLQDELHHGLLFERDRILLALGFGFDGASAACTVVEGGSRDSAVICNSTI
jgi:hypothetical protein